MPNNDRKPYPSDISDEEWAFVAPYLALVREDASQRLHDLREVFDALRWIVRAGASWRMMPHDFPPWQAVHQQTQRWLRAGVFEEMVRDLRALLRLTSDRATEPTTAILDSRTLRSTPESGARGDYDGAKRKKGSKVHAAVDTRGHLLALRVTPANEQDRAQVEELAEAVQEVTGESVEWRTWTGATPARSRPKRRRGTAFGWRSSSTPRPRRAPRCTRRWVVERSFACASRFRRLAKDYERLPETVAGLHFVAFACLFLNRAVAVLGSSP